MFEDITYEVILERMLDRVPSVVENQPIDKREGSIIYDALAPAAVELQLAYIELETIYREVFADTATRAFLVRRAKERGIYPYPATAAILKAVSTPSSLELEVGERFSLNDLNYEVISKITDGEYQVKCETEGKVGNKNLGFMLPIQYVQGLESIELKEVLIPGQDEEDTEAFRARYFASFNSKAFGGNIKDYTEKTMAIQGVGAVKVTPAWNGGGTVKITILDSEFNKASNTLISKVQGEIDPSTEGLGKGLAPIGHRVTVDTAETVTINIATHITFENGQSWGSLRVSIEDAIKGYLLELRKNWQSQVSQTVRISQIEHKILSINGVADISDTKINGKAENLAISGHQVPIYGGVTNE